MAKKLTEQQQKFLEALFEVANGDFVAAKRLAGYSENYPTSQIVKLLEEEIIEETKRYLSRSGPKAAIKLVDVLDNADDLGSKNRIAAAKDILDRIGIVKTEKVDVTHSGVFILPAKDTSDG